MWRLWAVYTGVVVMSFRINDRNEEVGTFSRGFPAEYSLDEAEQAYQALLELAEDDEIREMEDCQLP